MTPFLAKALQDQIDDEACQVYYHVGFLAENKVLRNG